MMNWNPNQEANVAFPWGGFLNVMGWSPTLETNAMAPKGSAWKQSRAASEVTGWSPTSQTNAASIQHVEPGPHTTSAAVKMDSVKSTCTS